MLWFPQDPLVDKPHRRKRHERISSASSISSDSCRPRHYRSHADTPAGRHLSPLVFYTAPLMVVGLIPIILIESFVLRRRLRLKWARALRVTAWANLVSTVVGVLGVYGLQPLGVHVYVGPFGNQAWLYGFLFILLVPLFLVSWWVEYQVARPRRALSV